METGPRTGSAPIRVAYLTRGVPHYRLPILRALTERGASVYVAACGSLGSGFIEPDELSGERFSFVRLRGAYPRWRGDVVRWLRTVRPSVIVLEHGALLDFTWTVLFDPSLARTPRVLWTHGVERRELHSGRRDLGAAARWWQLGLSDGVICYEETIAKRLRGALHGKVVGVARNTTGGPEASGAGGGATPRAVDPAALKHERGLAREFYILGLGRLVPEKEFHRLPNVLARVRASGLDAGLVFVGEGPSESRIRKRAADLGLSDDVVFAGAVGDPRELADWLAVSDVHVHPGAVGLAIVDAAFGGVPTVLPAPTPAGPFHSPEWTYVRNGEAGWVLEENTDEALASAVVRYLRLAPEERRVFSGRCADYARNHLSIDRMVDGMLETLGLVLRSRSG